MSQHDNEKLIEETISFVKHQLADAEGGHDWWHIHRVYQNTLLIATGEDVDSIVVQLAALLHDIADPKFHDGDEEIGPRLAQEFLSTHSVPTQIIDQVIYIIRNMSYKNSIGNPRIEKTPELMVVQDADRLDAIGAIGIARAFNYGGFKNRALYDPTIPPNLNMTKEAYKKSAAPTINHFYEKLLLLKDKMNTATGKRIAQERHQYMEQFLEQFYGEWNGER